MKFLKINSSKIRAIVDDEDYERCRNERWRIPDVNRPTGIRNGSNIPLANFILREFKLMYDHKNRNFYDNQKINFRICNYSQNTMNSSKIAGTSSKYKGVSFYKPLSNWIARIMMNDNSIFLGYFKTETKAAHAYDKKAKRLFGEFAKLNFPNARA